MFLFSVQAWLLLALLQFVLTWVFLGHLDAFLQVQPQLLQMVNPPGFTEVIVVPVFSMAAIVLLMMTPLLTMRHLAEERKNHTLTLLMSAPVSATEIVLGKFLALIAFLCGVIGLVMVLSLSLLTGGALDVGLLMSNALGLFLIACTFMALGLYISSLTAQPVIAAIGTLGILLIVWIMDLVFDDFGSGIRHFSIFNHFAQFNQGLLDSFSIAYFALLTFLLLVLTIRRLDGERLHG